MSNDTILEIAGVPVYDALTVHTPPTRSRSTAWERGLVTTSSDAPTKHNVPRTGCRSMGMAILGSFLALVLLVSGFAAYLHFLPTSSAKPASSSSLTTTPTTITYQQPEPGQMQQGQQPHALHALIPVGNILYETVLPACDTDKSLWSQNSLTHITCGDSATEMTDGSPNFLAGTFLDKLPNGYGIPDDYVLQVQVNESPSSHGGFGVFFRNQPGDIHQGTFSFLLFPQGRWEANVYDDTSGARTLLHAAEANIQLDGPVTIDIVIHANTFTFYLNGYKQGSVSSNFYPSGTLGLAVNSGGDAFFRNLAIYVLH